MPSDTVYFLNDCQKQEGSITEDFFIRPELSTFFADKHYDDMFDMF